MTSSTTTLSRLLYPLRSKRAEPIRFLSSNASPKRRVLITGGTDGVGKQAALKFAAEKEFEITISGRSERKADEVIEKCREINQTVAIEFIPADLTVHDKVVRFANTVAERQFDICILNAGVLRPEPAATVDGRDATIMTNLISAYMIANRVIERRDDKERNLHFVFTTSVLVKFLGSSLLGNRFFNPSRLSDWEQAVAPGVMSDARKYAISKIGMTTLSSSISHKGIPNVTATSVHPGTVYTNMMSNLPARQQLYIKLLRWFTTPLDVSGNNLFHAALHPLSVGKYFLGDEESHLPKIDYSRETIETFDRFFEQYKIYDC